MKSTSSEPIVQYAHYDCAKVRIDIRIACADVWLPGVFYNLHEQTVLK